MLVEMNIVLEKAEKWNIRLDECIEEHGDEQGIFKDWKVNMETLSSGKIFPIKEYPVGFYHFSNHDVDDLTDHKVIKEFCSFSPETMEEFRDFKGKMRNNYGICDNYKQILKEYPELKKDKNRKFVITLSMICKDQQSKNGGWRWHKWGKYIGKKKPKCEYLYDEPKIDEVLIYHIYEVERTDELNK